MTKPSKLLALLVLTGPVVARATTYYVSTSGSDGNSGTSLNAPFRTIQKAVDLTKPGDTVEVRGGNYAAGFHTKRKSGAAGLPITIKNYAGETPKIYGVMMGDFGTKNTIGWLRLEGFEITRGGYPAGITYHNASNLILRGNNIHDTDASGILGNGIDIEISQNIVARSGDADRCRAGNGCAHGMYLTGSNYKVVNNLVYGSQQYGIQVAGYPYDCTLYNSGQNCSSWSYAAPQYAGASSFDISNNTLALNQSRAGIVVWMKWAINNTIRNNIFLRNAEGGTKPASGPHGIDFYGAGPGHKVGNNIFWGPQSISPSSHIRETNAGSYADIGGNKFASDPKLVRAAMNDGDFRLSSGSPAINTGHNLYTSGVTIDLARTPRPQTGPFEMGAYETGASAVAVTPNSPIDFAIQ